MLPVMAVLLFVWHVSCSNKRQQLLVTQLRGEAQQTTAELAELKAAAAQHAREVQGLQAASCKQAEGKRQDLTTAIKSLQEQLGRMKTQMVSALLRLCTDIRIETFGTYRLENADSCPPP